MANWLQRVLGVTNQPAEQHTSPLYSISDPAFAGIVAMGMTAMSEVSELIALRQPAFWRCCSLIASTVATLPLRSYRTDDLGEREIVRSFLDNPAGPFPITRFQWVEMVLLHLLTHGEVGLLHQYNEAGALTGLWPVHPSNFQVKWNGYDKEFRVTMGGGQQKTFTSAEFTHVMWLTLDGTRGISPLVQFRKTIQNAEAQDLAANRQMVSGMLVGGLVSVDDDLPQEEAQALQSGLDMRLGGAENAGALRLVNRNLKFTPWTASNVDTQFIEQREFSISEMARIYGVPPHLVGQVDRSTSWGSGIQEQNRNFAQFTLMPITSRLEEALSLLLPAPRFVEFDYHGLLQGTPTEEINSLLAQTGRPIMTVNEARKVLNMAPIDGGDVLAPVAAPPSPNAAPSEDVLQKHALHLHVDKGAITNHTHFPGK